MGKVKQYGFISELFLNVELLEKEKYLPHLLELNNQLILAIRDNEINEGEKLIGEGADVNLQLNCVKFRKVTILGMAVEKRNFDSVQLLLKHNAHVNTLWGHYNYTSLLLAVSGNNMDIVQILLENNADSNIASKDGWTSVTCAAGKSLEMLELTLKYGGKVNTKNNKCSMYDTPLINAIWTQKDNSLDIIQKLLSEGANIEDSDGKGVKPLQIAIKNKCFQIVRELLSQGAKNDYVVFTYIDIDNINLLEEDIDEINSLINDAQLADKVLENPSKDLSLLILNDIELFVSRIIHNITKQGLSNTLEEFKLAFDENDSISYEIKEIFVNKLEEIGAVTYVKSAKIHVENSAENSVTEISDNLKNNVVKEKSVDPVDDIHFENNNIYDYMSEQEKIVSEEIDPVAYLGCIIS